MTRKMMVGDYSPRSISNYVREIRFIGEYYPEKGVDELTGEEVERYMIYLKHTLGVGRDKCRMTASALQWLYRHVLDKPYALPSKLYPRKTFTLPAVMSEAQVRQLFSAPLSIKQRALCEVFYSTGVRLEECTRLRISDIDSAQGCIHLKSGKGRKDRKLLLSPRCLETLRKYYRAHRPKEWLFEGQKAGMPMHPRSLGHAITMCMKAAGLDGKGFSAHTFRHSFATHMLDAGVDIHTIKTLLGHSKLETTMVYLHLQTRKRLNLISPLDALYGRNELETGPLDTEVL
jgi:site-specific recombinase XerD